MANKYSLKTGKGATGGGGVGGLADVRGIIADLLRLQQGDSAPPSAAPVGESVPGGGIRNVGGKGRTRVSEVLRRDKAATVGQMAAGDRAVDRPMPKRTPAVLGSAAASGFAPGGGGGAMPSPKFAAETGYSPGGGGGAVPQTAPPPSNDGGDGGGDGGAVATGRGTFGQIGADLGSVFGPIGAGLGAGLGGIADAFWGDDESALEGAQRHLKEQQFEMRQNFNKAYYDYFLPMQIGTKIHAYQKMDTNTENFDYANEALKGFVEGSAGIWGGSGPWNDVFDYIDDNVDFSEVEANANNETPDPAVTGVLTWMLDAAGMPKGVSFALAEGLSRWGSALMDTVRRKEEEKPRW